jgi:hypothetical protein
VAGWLARLPVRARLTAWYVALLAVILATLAFFLLLRLRADLVAEVDKGLDAQAAGVLADTDGGAARLSEDSLAGLSRGATVAQLLSSAGQVQDQAGTAAPDPVGARKSVVGAELRVRRRSHRAMMIAA